MISVLAYLCRRAREWTTWVGVALFLVFIGAIIFYRQDILLLLGAPLSGLLAALPDRLLKLPWRNLARVAANAIFRTLKKSAAPPAAVTLVPITAEQPRSIPMSLVDDFKVAVEKAAENAAMAALKAGIASLPGPAQAAANAVVNVAEAPTVANITVAVADILAVVEAALAEVPAGYVPATEVVAVPASEPAV